jgi:hypothetical protein
MKLPKSYLEILAVRQLALDDLMAHSDAQLRQEADEDGEDVDGLATKLRLVLQNTTSQVLRLRLTEAQRRLVNTAARPAKLSKYPALEMLKRQIQSAFESQPELGLAFREGKKQSEADWHSLYDDLIELGAISRDEDDL